MDSYMDLFKKKATLAANAAGVVSRKAKLRADIMFIERDIKNRQHTFGVQLYDYVSVWSARPEFFAANEDNILIATLRPPLIQAQREIAALHLKRTQLKERINMTNASRTASYNQKSEHWTESISNAGRTTMIAGSEAKLKAELAIIENNINHYKHMFGISIYQQFTLLEDTKNWLPTDREIRSLYDSCRKDIENYRNKIQSKENEIKALDGDTTATDNPNQTNNTGIIDSPHHLSSPQNQQQQQQQFQQPYAFGSASLPPDFNYMAPAPSTLPPAPQNSNALFFPNNSTPANMQQDRNQQKDALDDFW